MMSAHGVMYKGLSLRQRWRSMTDRHRPLAGFFLCMVALVSFPELPKAPEPPEPTTLSLFVWNTTDRPAAMAVRVNGILYIEEAVPAGQGVSRHDLLELTPGAYPVEVLVDGQRHEASITVAPQGDRWLVVTWWGRSVEIGLQHQPPWVKPRASHRPAPRGAAYSPSTPAASRTA